MKESFKYPQEVTEENSVDLLKRAREIRTRAFNLDLPAILVTITLFFLIVVYFCFPIKDLNLVFYNSQITLLVVLLILSIGNSGAMFRMTSSI